MNTIRQTKQKFTLDSISIWIWVSTAASEHFLHWQQNNWISHKTAPQ